MLFVGAGLADITANYVMPITTAEVTAKNYWAGFQKLIACVSGSNIDAAYHQDFMIIK